MFEQLLSRVGARLDAHAIPYMIIGGQAVLLYGEPRLTRDIDITLGVNTGRLNDVISISKELSLKPIPEDPASFVKETMVLPAVDGSTGVRVDFIFSSTPYETGAIKRAKRVKVLGQEVLFASPEDLRIHKIFAGRARDIEDARSVVVKQRDMDIGYIRATLKDFDEGSEKKDFVKVFEEMLKE